MNDDSNSGEGTVLQFMRGANATRDEATMLFDEGFTALEEVAYVPFGELRLALRGDVERATKLREDARKTILSNLDD